MGKYVNLKLGKMRKEQEFIVMQCTGDKFQIQSEKSIGLFDVKTGKGKLSTKGCYFHHLSLCGVEYQLTESELKLCLDAMILKGTTIDGIVTFM